MTSETEKITKRLKRLKQKAEICRYAHSMEMYRARRLRCAFQIIFAALSLLLAVFTLLGRSEMFSGWTYWLMLFIALIPPLMLFGNNISGIFRWAVSEEAHEIAVYRWGEWIRKSETIVEFPEDGIYSKMEEDFSKARQEYYECMEKTPLIPTNKFLRYKREFMKFKQESKEIDEEFCPKREGKTEN